MLKITFLLLALCFTAMLALAFSSKNFVIVAHVLLLVTIGTVLFVLLNRSVYLPVYILPVNTFTLDLSKKHLYSCLVDD